ncbi:putative aldo-keto reductase [Pantoea agglomerans]|uniref:Putative aldo-keto reductase n=1 Tax=Enterobacter agglomerans TaxID=549 RepID=A0A379ACG6_ENTAG|nr:putative aldo-keto reductase [Pantoea agglomerans]
MMRRFARIWRWTVKTSAQHSDASLKRLNTDYLDLYQLHWPQRQTNYFGKLGYQYSETTAQVTLLETLEALTEQVRAGKIRYIGVSNETAWGRDALSAAGGEA